MDGFEAVTAIKNNPDTATIPIMMYTSQRGELYVGQARALGAVGVLPKQVEPVEVSKVLESLRVIGGDAEEMSGAGAKTADEIDNDTHNLENLDQNLRELISDLFDQQRAVLRRDLLDSYETIASRVATEIRDTEEPALAPDEDAGPNRGRTLQIFAGILAVAVLIFASLYIQREQSWRQLSAQNTQLLRSLEQQQTAQVSGAQQVQQQFENYERSLGDTFLTALDAIEWGMNQNAQYAFDDVPLGAGKLQQFENLLAILTTMDFVGQVQVEVHTGDYCMVAADADRWIPAPGDSGVENCDRIGFGLADSMEMGLRQSVSFANFINVANERTGGRIRFDIASLGNMQPDVSYPSSRSGLTAGFWNEIAARNNRVVVSLFPDNF
jgi:CheY-like chemotaxis protein